MDHGISSGSLRTKISLKGGYSQLSLVVPFYGMKSELPAASPLLGSDDLITHFDLGGSYNRYCGSSKKLRDDLASFLPQVCGTSNLSSRNDASCSLRQLVEKPPITGKEVAPLSASAMVGFKLAPGPVPENYRLFDLNDGLSQELSNFNDAEEVKEKHRKKMKRSLDDLEDNERKVKKHQNYGRRREAVS
ncbi:mediator of RNA pol II transcription subunit 19 domain-containing protein [Ditylenchus destructor]|uniref:Mediator of RNA polymerase II transcription subunit 19 n=1 Tax=Ditylenchus destructor TaxID=166010 RepID=A0AAD4NA08_9BILA|nr:mediator of RNA pol II transcription subunit 19 domain-containing protein [Ditylenchus destructor]